MKGKYAGWFALVVAIVFTGVVHTRIEPRTRADHGEAYVPKPSTAKAMAFGFDAVLSDFYWLQAVQAVGGNVVVDDAKARQIGKLIDVVTTLDPWVDHPYRFAGIWMTEGEENIRTAIDLLHRSVEYHPDDWRNWFYIGFAHFFLLGENLEAADALETASDLPGSPAYLPRLVVRLRSTTADIDVSAVFLRQLIESTEDGERRAGYQAALDEIEVEQKARFLDQARAAYVKLAGEDITRVEDLVLGKVSVVRGLPRPFPDALPAAAGSGARWTLDDEGRIMSTYYGTRYELHFSLAAPVRDAARERAEAGGSEDEAASASQGENELEEQGTPEEAVRVDTEGADHV